MYSEKSKKKKEDGRLLLAVSGNDLTVQLTAEDNIVTVLSYRIDHAMNHTKTGIGTETNTQQCILTGFGSEKANKKGSNLSAAEYHFRFLMKFNKSRMTKDCNLIRVKQNKFFGSNIP